MRDKSKRLSGRTGVERRARWLRAHPFCEHCLKERPRRLTATCLEVDHIVPLFKGGADDDTNLQTLCKAHHEQKTADDMGYQPAVRIGLDGFPEVP